MAPFLRRDRTLFAKLREKFAYVKTLFFCFVSLATRVFRANEPKKRVHPRFLVFQIISASMFSGNISIVSFAIDLGHKIRK